MTRFGSFVLPRSAATDDLADLGGCNSDLARAIRLLEHARTELGEIPSQRHEVPSAIAEAGVIGYGRCFTTGRRRRLYTDDVPTQARVDHDFAMMLRNSFTAHSVGNLEHNTVVANAEGWPSADAIFALSSRHVLTLHEVERVLKAAAIVRDVVLGWIDAAKSTVLLQNAALKVEDLVKLQQPRMDPMPATSFNYATRPMGTGSGVVQIPIHFTDGRARG